MKAQESHYKTTVTAHAEKVDESEMLVVPAEQQQNGDLSRQYQNREDLEKAYNEAKESEAQLADSEARLQTIIDMVPSFLWTSLPDGSKDISTNAGTTTRVYLWRKDRAGDGRSLFTRKTWTG